MDWDAFKPLLKKIHQKPRKSNAGRKPWDPVRMFKMLVLQTLYNLSDDQTEFQVRDRLLFQRFLGLALEDRVPDAKTLWLFREQSARHGVVEKLFDAFDEQLWLAGYLPWGGQIIDASLMNVPRNRNRTRSVRRISMPAGPRSTARATMATRTNLPPIKVDTHSRGETQLKCYRGLITQR